MTLILSGTDGLSDVDGTAATPAIRGTDANTGIFFGTDIIGFSEGGAEAARFNASGVFTTTNDATIQGLTVGRGAGAVSTNTAVGASALAANTSGTHNTAVGLSALQANSSGTYNTAVGLQALLSNTTGATNSAFGFNSLSANTTGANNVAVGVQALTSNTTASNNTAVGYQAGYANTTGTSMVAMGRNAALNNTTGNDITALGRDALYSNTTGSSNTALGSGALLSNTTASRNTAVGYVSATANTTGTRNTALGAYSLYVATTGNFNTAIGDVALEGLTTGSSNTAIGIGSGGAITTGSKNTIIGGYTGNQGGLDIRTASNYIVLSDGDGNPRGIFANDGAFLLGKTTVDDTTEGFAYRASKYLMLVRDGAPPLSLKRLSDNGEIAQFYRIGTQVGSISVTASATAYNTSSDYRLKEAITPMTGALAKVALLKPCTYKWKVDGSDGQGFIAHELDEVVKGCVTGEKDAVQEEQYEVTPAVKDEEGRVITEAVMGTRTVPKYQGIDTSFLVATLTAAIQEQQALITQLQADVSALKGQP